MILLFVFAALCANAQPARRLVKVTSYAAPLEADFGDKATEKAQWRLEGSKILHESLFAPGFASRDAEDPKHPGIMGAGMEGSGWISPDLHDGDRALSSALKAGRRVLTLERWDAKRRKATFVLTRGPVAGDGEPLVVGVSAAVRAGNRTFPSGRWVRLFKNGAPAGYRRLHDECSSCESDDHLDLYRAAGDLSVDGGRWEAELMPKGFRPK